MSRFLYSLVLASFMVLASAQPKKPSSTTMAKAAEKPKLVVGIVIDQMRWDYLYRYQSLYSANGGFRRLMGEGFSCDNTFIPYTPTVTACGHTCVYTGSVPAIHGITGNSWWDRQLDRSVYCSEDKTVQGVGGKDEETGMMSPRNMLTTTISDQLRMSNNFKSKVIGVALKDRGAILPAGHRANAAYWYDGKSGNFITSTYYMDALPAWVEQFNKRKLVDSLYGLNWKTALDSSLYLQYATADVKEYEGKPFGKEQVGFPYDLSKFIGKDASKILTTPHGNTLTEQMAEAAIVAESLGKGNATDLIAVSFSSPDYIGHSFGPDSWEMVDDYVRLDKELGRFFDFLDKQIGKGKYTVFLTADHAVAHIPGFLKENKLPGGTIEFEVLKKNLNKMLAETYGKDGLVQSMYNYQVTLDKKLIKAAGLDQKKITESILDELRKQPAIARAFPVDDMMVTPLNPTLRQMLVNGYYPDRCGDIQMVLKPGYIDGGNTGTTHGLWYPYDSHIPLLWYGNGIKKGRSHREVYMTDIAPTLAALLDIQMPNGSVGKVIEEVLQ